MREKESFNLGKPEVTTDSSNNHTDDSITKRFKMGFRKRKF